MARTWWRRLSNGMLRLIWWRVLATYDRVWIQYRYWWGNYVDFRRTDITQAFIQKWRRWIWSVQLLWEISILHRWVRVTLQFVDMWWRDAEWYMDVQHTFIAMEFCETNFQCKSLPLCKAAICPLCTCRSLRWTLWWRHILIPSWEQKTPSFKEIFVYNSLFFLELINISLCLMKLKSFVCNIQFNGFYI